MSESRKIITSKDAAKYLKMSPEILEAYRASKRGPRYYDLNGIIRYCVDDLNRWLNINSVETVWLMSDDALKTCDEL